MKLFAGIVILFISLSANLCGESEKSLVEGNRVNGVSLVNPPFEVDSGMMASVKRVNASWVAIIPIAFSKEGQPEVYYNSDHQWWGERLEGTAALIRLAHANQLKVLLKPHVWLREQWIGDYHLENEVEWREWENQYSRYILDYVDLADSLGVEMFCIGTEYKQAVNSRTAYWRKLIDRIRHDYEGELTYAANWDNYENVGFWDQLDYIGIDAYFPLLHDRSPSVSELSDAWRPIKKSLLSMSKKLDKPILFTEYGYQSVNGASGNHWEVSKSQDQLNHGLQSRCYESLYRNVWNEDWFAGGFLWKWHFDESRLARENLDFTPQGKPVEKVIARWYYGTNVAH